MVKNPTKTCLFCGRMLAIVDWCRECKEGIGDHSVYYVMGDTMSQEDINQLRDL